MGPLTLEAFGAYTSSKIRKVRPYLELLTEAQHFLVSEAIFNAAVEICQQSFSHRYSSEIWIDFRLPAETVVIETSMFSIMLFETWVEDSKIPSGEYVFCTPLHNIGVGALDPILLTMILPKRGSFQELRFHQDLKDDTYFAEEIRPVTDSMIFVAHVILSLINTPRLVTRSNVPQKARERATWKLAYSQRPTHWHQLTWTIGKPVKASSDVSHEEGHHRALHFCRAHWRKSEAGKPKAEWVTPYGRAPGWWCWVESSWKGHPDYGIKLHHYTPRLDDADQGYKAKVGIDSQLAGQAIRLAGDAAGRQANEGG